MNQEGVHSTGRRYGVSVPVDDLPFAVFGSEYGGHPKSDRGELACTPDLRSASLDLKDVGQFSSPVLRDPFVIEGLPFSELRSCKLQYLFDFRPSSGRGSKRIGERHVVAVREESLLHLRISLNELVGASVIFLDELLQIKVRHVLALHPAESIFSHGEALDIHCLLSIAPEEDDQ